MKITCPECGDSHDYEEWINKEWVHEGCPKCDSYAFETTPEWYMCQIVDVTTDTFNEMKKERQSEIVVRKNRLQIISTLEKKLKQGLQTSILQDIVKESFSSTNNYFTRDISKKGEYRIHISNLGIYDKEARAVTRTLMGMHMKNGYSLKEAQEEISNSIDLLSFQYTDTSFDIEFNSSIFASANYVVKYILPILNKSGFIAEFLENNYVVVKLPDEIDDLLKDAELLRDEISSIKNDDDKFIIERLLQNGGS